MRSYIFAAAVAAALIGAWVEPAQAQGAAPDWLLGQWEGGLKVAKSPERIMRVFGTRTDGRIVSQWYLPGQKPAASDLKMEGDAVVLTTSAKSIVNLKRVSDTELSGTFAVPNGKPVEASFKRVTTPSKYDGKWNGRARDTASSCWVGNYAVAIVNGYIRGTVTFQSGERVQPISTVTGFVTNDDADITLIKQSSTSRDSSFSAKFDGNKLGGTDQAVGGKCVYNVVLEKS